jgi:hypothetical protein
MFGSVKLFRFPPRLSENQLDAHNLVSCPSASGTPRNYFPWVYLIIFQELFLRREALHEQFQGFNIPEPEFTFFACSLMAGIQASRDNLEAEFANFQCDTNVNPKYSG